VVAVSGGADSIALLIGLHRIAGELGLLVRAAHLHHGLRGPEADQDLAFVRALCSRLGVPLTWSRWNTRLRMRRRGLSGQAGLRVLRREFLLRTAEKAGAVAIATAHTSDDQLETMLLRLIRGTGLPGLGGMSPRRGAWIKPMLGATRADVEADLAKAGQPWREDRSNRDLRYARTRVRQLAIPALLECLDPSLDRKRARAKLLRRTLDTAREARGAHRALDRWASRVLPRFSRIQPGVAALDGKALGAIPLAIRRAVLRKVWQRLESNQGLTGRNLQALDDLIRNPHGTALVALPGGWQADRDGGGIRFRKARQITLPEPLRLRVPGRVSWNSYDVKGRWTTAGRALRGLPAKSSDVEFFAAEGIEGGLEVRVARADERFIPFGRRHSIRIGEFLSKQRVSRQLRICPAVLADHGGILWVIGVRRSARAMVRATTRRALRVHAESHD